MPVEYELLQVPLAGGKINCVLHVKRPNATHNIVFFQGDLTNFALSRSRESQMAYNQPLPYEYSVEYLCWKLCSLVGNSFDILYVRPTIMLDDFSIYSNFLLCDSVGIPRWRDIRLNRDLSAPGDVFLRIVYGSARNCAVGFSKGCVVIMGLLEEGNASALSKIERIVLIDPGTSLPGQTFPFKSEDYMRFPSEMPIVVYVSPYQFSDPERPWLRKEILDFVEKSGAQIHFVLMDKERSLKNHFNAIIESLKIERLG